jgi:transcription elongation GreA/GreB family factor
MELGQLKLLVYAACKNVIDERLSMAQMAMSDAQASANQEEKSSAGDKYETGRAMAQQERDKAATQVAEATKMKEAFSRMDPNKNSTTIEFGSLVQTNQGYFYMGIAVGKLAVKGIECLAISQVSPIGKLMMGKQPGGSVTFNKQTFEIQTVC